MVILSCKAEIAHRLPTSAVENQEFWDSGRSWLWLYMVSRSSTQVFVRQVSEGSAVLKWPLIEYEPKKEEKAIFIPKGQHGQATWSFPFPF